MNTLFDRLYNWVRSELDWDRSTTFEKDDWTDPDLKAAEEELEAFLKGSHSNKSSQRHQEGSSRNSTGQGTSRPDDRNVRALVMAYMELGLAPGATWEDVKAAHRSLLLTHHPDKHGGSAANMKKATEKSQRINEAYQIIKKALDK